MLPVNVQSEPSMRASPIGAGFLRAKFSRRRFSKNTFRKNLKIKAERSVYPKVA